MRFLNPILSVLRFLNLLEPGRPVLSITNIAMWLGVIGLGLGVFTHRQIDLTTILAFFTTSALYGWKKFVLAKTGKVVGDDPYASYPPAPIPPAEQ